MKVLVLRSFAARLPSGEQVRYVEGDEIEMPGGLDWLTAGLVAPLQETAAMEPAEKAVKPRATRRKATPKKADK